MKNRRIVFAEGDDPRVRAAAQKLAQEGLCQPLLLSEKDDFSAGVGLERLNPAKYSQHPGFPEFVELVEVLYELRKHKGITREQAKKLARHPLYFAALLVRTKQADGGIGGALFPTAEVMRAGLQVIGPQVGTSLVSSAFLMLVKNKTLTFADCAVLPEPDEQQLACIALAAAELHEKLCKEKPRVALLSFSTYGSADHPSARKVRAAAALLRQKAPQILCAGEMQADAALVPEVAAAKAAQSPIQGDANVLVFPDLNSGNIGYKLVRHFADATAVGPIVTGLNAPFMDVSRGCDSEDLVLMACIAALLA